MAAGTQFAEELRQLSAIDQKAGSLLNGNALLFACVSLVDFAKDSPLGEHVDSAVIVLQLLLLGAAFMALRAAKMMGKFEKWPIRDEAVSEEDYQAALAKIAEVVRERRHAIDICWTLTMIGVVALAVLVVLQPFG